MASVPDVISDSFGEGGVRRMIPLTGHQHRRTDLRDVSTGETGVDAHSEHIRAFLIRPRCRNALDHRAHIGTPAIDFLQHRAAHSHCGRRDVASHRPVQDIPGLMTCVVHIYVRVGLERHDDVGQRTHPAADIRMWVKRDGNWDCFAHHASNARK